MGAFMYRESASAPWQELPLIGSINIGGAGGTGGQFAEATITKSGTATFDLSNYINEDSQFILFFTFGSTVRAAFAPFINKDYGLKVSDSYTSSYGIEGLYGKGAQSVFTNYMEADYNAATGILSFNITNSNYTPGVSATLLYID